MTIYLAVSLVDAKTGAKTTHAVELRQDYLALKTVCGKTYGPGLISLKRLWSQVESSFRCPECAESTTVDSGAEPVQEAIPIVLGTIVDEVGEGGLPGELAVEISFGERPAREQSELIDDMVKALCGLSGTRQVVRVDRELIRVWGTMKEDDVKDWVTAWWTENEAKA